MNKSLKIALIVLAVIILGGAAYYSTSSSPKGQSQVGLRECPDEKIVNRMPGPGSTQSSYYIKDGLRREISEYDAAWVASNCSVPEQQVF